MAPRNTLRAQLALVALVGPALFASLLACRGPSRVATPETAALALESEQAEQGQLAFMQLCHQCHPNGGAGLGPSLSASSLVPAVVRTQVRAGLGAMPAFSEEELSDEGLDAIIAYLQEIRGRGPASTEPTTEEP